MGTVNKVNPNTWSELTGTVPTATAGDVPTVQSDKTVAFQAPTGGGSAWGDITGTLSAQTDLQSALDAKADVSTASRWLSKTVNWLRFQALAWTGQTPDAGAYTLMYGAAETASLVFNATAAEIQSALDAIPALTGLVSVVDDGVNTFYEYAFVISIDLDDPELLAFGENTVTSVGGATNPKIGVLPNTNSFSVPFLDLGIGGKIEDIWVQRLAFTGADSGDIALSDTDANPNGADSLPGGNGPDWSYETQLDVYPVDGTFTNLPGDSNVFVSVLQGATNNGDVKFPVGPASGAFTIHLWLLNPGSWDVTANKQTYHILVSGDVEVAS